MCSLCMKRRSTTVAIHYEGMKGTDILYGKMTYRSVSRLPDVSFRKTSPEGPEPFQVSTQTSDLRFSGLHYTVGRA